jgi:hypothetical protein
VLDVAMYFNSQRKFGDCDLVISPEALAGFSTFDTKCIREIYEIGYNATLEKIGAIEKALVGRP